jgi:glycerol-3-phosphate acyltransferase PlsY
MSMTWPIVLACCLVAYLIGAIPFSYLFVRALKGVDLRTVGSGNLGSTNAMRVLGWKLGLVVQAFDILKGWLPVFALAYHAQTLHLPGVEVWATQPGANPVDFDRPGIAIDLAALAIGLAAILGHMFPVYMKFRGGKGVNTSLGVFLAVAPKATLLALTVGLVLLAVFRIVSVTSMTGAVVLFLAVWYFYPENTTLILLTAAIGALVIFLHRANIRRLLAGTEPRLGRRHSATGDCGEPENEASQT